MDRTREAHAEPQSDPGQRADVFDSRARTQSGNANQQQQQQARLPPVVLSTRTFVAFWAMLVVLHAASAIFLFACARLYWYIEQPYLSYYTGLLAPQSDRHFRLFGTMLGVLGACHALECLGQIVASIQARKAAVTSIGVFHALFLSCGRLVEKIRRHRGAQYKQPAASRRRTRIYMLLEEGADLFSIESKQFDMVFSLREVVVVIAQCVQCYTFSSRIARPWINHVSVTLVVTNCVSVAMLYRLLRRYDRFIRRASVRIASLNHPSWRASPAFARLLCHVLDCMLTFAMSVILPVATIMPYVKVYDPKRYTFPLALLYSDTAFTSMIRENQALFARSWLDMGYKYVPHLSIYFCLLVIAGVLRTRKELPAQVTPALLASAAIQAPVQVPLLQRNIPSSGSQRQRHSPLTHQSSISRNSKRKLRDRMKKSAIAILFMILGAGIVALHLRATLSNSAGSVVTSTTSDTNADSSSTNPGNSKINMCLQPVYPWFASGDSCAVVEYNCYRHEVDTPPSTMLDTFDASTVSVIIFSHCQALVMPPAIQALSNLLGIEVYNSTIVEWSVNAALLDTHHPHLVYLFFALVNMTELPPGVLQKPFPRRLGDIEFSHTNLTAFPSSLPDVWAGVELIYLEHSLLTEIPIEIVSLPALSELSLIGNEIVALPDDFSNLIAVDDFYFLALCSNPFTSLPSTMRSGLTFGFLSLENTGVSSMPTWVDKRVTEGLYLFGTPLCSSDTLLSSSSSVVESSCTSRDSRVEGRYPLSFVAAAREL